MSACEDAQVFCCDLLLTAMACSLCWYFSASSIPSLRWQNRAFHSLWCKKLLHGVEIIALMNEDFDESLRRDLLLRTHSHSLKWTKAGLNDKSTCFYTLGLLTQLLPWRFSFSLAHWNDRSIFVSDILKKNKRMLTQSGKCVSVKRHSTGGLFRNAWP